VTVIPRLLLVGVLSVAIALCLALVPKLHSAMLDNKEAASVFGPSAGRQMTDRNVVDVLVQIPLQLRIRKVELTTSTLTVELNLPRSADEEVVVRDLYTFTQKVFAGTSNINNVLVRVMDYSASSRSSGGKLLLALDALRDKGKDMVPPSEHETNDVLEQYLRQHFKMTYTDQWRVRYPM
jgi:hypothetical protein